MLDENAMKIIQEIAYEENLTYSQAEACVKSEFDCVRDTIAEGEFKSVHLPYFGKFWVDPRRVEHLNTKKSKQ